MGEPPAACLGDPLPLVIWAGRSDGCVCIESVLPCVRGHALLPYPLPEGEGWRERRLGDWRSARPGRTGAAEGKMASARRLRVGIIGLGIGMRHASSFAQVP